MSDLMLNPAEQAAEEAFASVKLCIDERKSFLLEAGAGAGKTYSLVRALNYLIGERGAELLRKNQRVACITYTNVATDEIKTRTDRHAAIESSTIHAFCWSMIKKFQLSLKNQIPNLKNWSERLEQSGGVGNRSIDYELGHPKVEERRLLLHHNDVLALTIKLMENRKFLRLLANRYPIIFIDEYQDTDKDFAEALKAHVLSMDNGPLIGFFGDHWQKIYGNGCGSIEHQKLQRIGKEANFRSVPAIVNCLNRMRPELPQQVKDPDAKGTVAVYHTNDWIGVRRTGQHWGGDLPSEYAHAYLDSLRKHLADEGWDFSPEKTKVLMLTHNVLAAEQGYSKLANVFDYSDSFIKKEDPHIKFFVETLEPVCTAYLSKRFGEMFEALGGRTPTIKAFSDKVQWSNDMKKLIRLRETGTIGDVIDHLKSTQRPRLPEVIERRERELEQAKDGSDVGDPPSMERLRNLRDVSYQEVIACGRFIDEKTPFSTKHGVKGAEFENVLAVFGRGWNLYDFNQFLEMAGSPNSLPLNKIDAFERNRNLFYVVCSRPKTRLAIFFTQKLSGGAMATLAIWFGANNIHSFEMDN